MDRQERTVVVGLIWDDDEVKNKVVGALAPLGQVIHPIDLWYKPNPEPQDLVEASEPEALSAIATKAPDRLNEYLQAMESKVAYPLHWQSLRVRTPIQDIYNAKVGSLGDYAKDRIDFQILDTLLTLYGRIPGFPVKKLFAKVKEISAVEAITDTYMSRSWSDIVEKMITKLDKDAIFRYMKTRLRETANLYHSEIDHAIEEMDDDDELLDRLPKTLVVLITDIRTEQEAAYVAGLDDGILVHVDTGDDLSAFKKKTIKQMVTIDGSQEPVELRHAIQSIALEMRD